MTFWIYNKIILNETISNCQALYCYDTRSESQQKHALFSGGVSNGGGSDTADTHADDEGETGKLLLKRSRKANSHMIVNARMRPYLCSSVNV